MNEIADNLENIEDPKSRSDISPPQESGETIGGAVIAAASGVVTRVGNRRWLICALLFFAATINYVDRQVIGILKPTLQTEFGWTELDYSWIVFSFQTAYAIGLLFVGKLMDRIGTKIGFALAIIVWSIAAMAHAWAVSIGTWASPVVAPVVYGVVSVFNSISALFGAAPWTFTLSVSVVGFMVARFLLGLGEAEVDLAQQGARGLRADQRGLLALPLGRRRAVAGSLHELGWKLRHDVLPYAASACV